MWEYWHSLPATGQVSLCASIIGATIAGAFGIIQALIKDRPKFAVKFGIGLLLAYAVIAVILFVSHESAPPDVVPLQIQANPGSGAKEHKQQIVLDAHRTADSSGFPSENASPLSSKAKQSKPDDAIKLRAIDWLSSPPSFKK